MRLVFAHYTRDRVTSSITVSVGKCDKSNTTNNNIIIIDCRNAHRTTGNIRIKYNTICVCVCVVLNDNTIGKTALVRHDRNNIIISYFIILLLFHRAGSGGTDDRWHDVHDDRGGVHIAARVLLRLPSTLPRRVGRLRALVAAEVLFRAPCAPHRPRDCAEVSTCWTAGGAPRNCTCDTTAADGTPPAPSPTARSARRRKVKTRWVAFRKSRALAINQLYSHVYSEGIPSWWWLHNIRITIIHFCWRFFVPRRLPLRRQCRYSETMEVIHEMT